MKKLLLRDALDFSVRPARHDTIVSRCGGQQGKRGCFAVMSRFRLSSVEHACAAAAALLVVFD
jgi:hypothetical protein